MATTRITREAATTAASAAPATWAPCPTCWGQRRILVREQAPNGEGALLRPATCEFCLGVGEVLAA